MFRGKEPLHPKARWLVGHQDMSPRSWDLGILIPTQEIKVRVQQDSTVCLCLHHVGTIVDVSPISFWDPENECTGFDKVLEIIFKQKEDISTIDLLYTLDQIYGVPFSIRPDSFPGQLTDVLLKDDKAAALLEIIECFKVLPPSTDRRAAAWVISSHLGFQERLAGSQQHGTRLSYAGTPVHQSDQYNDHLVSVLCKGCNHAFIYRVLILKSAGTPLNLYRFPGLKCTASKVDGLGIIVHGKEVVGRMIDGTPACNCIVHAEIELC